MTPRNYAGMSPEELSMQDARIAGAKAGRNGSAAGVNPYQDDTPEYLEWETHRREALYQFLTGSFA